MSERSSQQPGGTPQRNANDTTSRAETSTTATQQGSISANPFATLFSQILGGAGPLGQMAAASAGSAANAPAGGGEVGGCWFFLVVCSSQFCAVVVLLLSVLKKIYFQPFSFFLSLGGISLERKKWSFKVLLI